jgi:hypothetical protein
MKKTTAPEAALQPLDTN